MNHLLSILLTAILCATGSAQTIKTLGYNTNGQVLANTGTNVSLTFTNEVVKFATGDLSISNQSIVGTGISFSFEDGSFDAGATIVRENLGFSANLNTLWTATNASNARSAVGLGLPALTNTSNVTAMRALAGTTNTNQPFSGTITFQDFSDNTHTVSISNGVVISYTGP